SQNDAGAFRSIAECLLGHAFEERAQLSVFSPEFPHKGGHLFEIFGKVIGSRGHGGLYHTTLAPPLKTADFSQKP
ncbi:hypothetical protein, partial [Novosphingobium sp. 11B]